MKLSPYSNIHQGVSIGLFPTLLVLALLAIHFFSGSLTLPLESDVRMQRDFNTAIGMSFLSGYFWFSLRFIHQNVASTLISILVKTSQLSRFNEHRTTLTSTFKLHAINCFMVAVLVTLVYVFMENLLSGDVKFHQYVITINALIFWHLFFLFLVQVTSNIRYLKANILNQTKNYYDYLNSLSSLIRLGFVNGTISLGAVGFFPIFWFGKSIPFIDTVFVTFFAFIVSVYVFRPVQDLRRQWTREKRNRLNTLKTEMSEAIKSGDNDQANNLASELEVLTALSMKISNVKDKVRLFACLMLIVTTWSFFSAVSNGAFV